MDRLKTVAALVILLVSCRHQEEAARTALRPTIAAASRATAPDGSVLEGVFVSSDTDYSWLLESRVEGVLRFSWTVDGGQAHARLVVQLETTRGKRSSQSFDRELLAASGRGVAHEEMELDSDVRAIHFESGNESPVLLSDLRIVSPDESNEAVVLILIDTLRRDSVGVYGASRPTTPRIDEVFSSAWKGEKAYAPASWTTPSVASLFTGVRPERLQSPEGSPLGIPEGFPTVAEDFSADGWSTAAFVANPVINVESGFAHGFSTFYVAPYDVMSMELPGTTVLERAAGWLRVHAGERVFLYVHMIDPHEPYHAPDRDSGRTPFDPEYAGSFNGYESHAALTFDLDPTESDVAHLRALYDDGVRYTDSLIGAFWDGLPASLQQRATVVLTSDHGEEFLEHGGWKHGPSLYDEVLAIPLLIRSPSRVEGLDPLVQITLTDLGPTLGAMFGVRSSAESRDGQNLSDTAQSHRGGFVVSMLTGGAARVAVVADGRKLVFFDRLGERGLPDPEADPMGHRLGVHLRDVLPSLGQYDLETDPLETRLLEPDPETFMENWRIVEVSIAHTRSGIEMRWFPSSAGDIARIRVRTNHDELSEGFALDDGDLIESTGEDLQIRFNAAGRADVDGVLFATESDLTFAMDEDSGCIEFHSAEIVVVEPGESLTLINDEIPTTLPRFEPGDRCSVLYVWKTTSSQPLRSKTQEETRRLRALGYIH